MTNGRPDPDELLLAVQQGEKSRGRLKVFLGASAGVGKTYAMLSEAHERLKRGSDVVIGYVEAHQRAETHAMMDGLEAVPLRTVFHRGAELKEVDVRAIIERKPELVLIDELAHSNPPGSTHTKRWQDINDVLDAGINVFTAVNIQHLESLNDVVAQVTGIQVNETVPDSFFEQADEVELIDLPPAELQQRLKDGKVYIPERIEHALSGFFKATNLTALRELALRKTADSVDAEMQRLRIQEGSRSTWATRDRILVCIAPNTMGQRIVRAAARMAAATHAEMIAVYVESDRQSSRNAEVHDHARQAMDLAQELGFEVVQLQSHDIVHEVVSLAQRRNASLIVVGKPIKPRWREIAFGSVVDELVRRSGDIDVHVITGTPEVKTDKAPRAIEVLTSYGMTVGAVGVLITTGIGLVFFQWLGLTNLAVLYILTVTLTSVRCNRAETAAVSVAAVLAFNFFFVDPRFTLHVTDLRFILVFFVMLAVGLIISSLTHQLRDQLSQSSERERRTASLYSLSKRLAQGRNKRDIAKAARAEIAAVFDCDVAVLLSAESNLLVVAPSESKFESQANEKAVADWVFEHQQPAGKGTDTLPGSAGMYLPLKGGEIAVGVIALRSKSDLTATSQIQLLETFANGLGLALERTILAKQSNDARLTVESERLRSTLLSSISHDLRTPLTSITGAASTLRSGAGNVEELSSTIYTEATRLNHQIQNLLDMTRLQSGGVDLKLTWQSPQELVASAVDKCKVALQERHLTIETKGRADLIVADGLLIEKALVNIIENACKFTEAGQGIKVTIFSQSKELIMLITDEGKGFPTESLGKAFTAGVRGESGGFGLGLAIVDSIMKLHNGRCSATNLPNGGAAVRLEFPLPSEQPMVPHD